MNTTHPTNSEQTALWNGRAGLLPEDADEGTRKRVIETIRAAFDPYVYGADVRFTAACWMISAGAANV